MVEKHNDFDVFPVSEDGCFFFGSGADVRQGVGEVLVGVVAGIVEDVAEVEVAVGDGEEEAEVVGKDSDGAFALQVGSARDWQVAITSVQESSHALFVFRLRHILEVGADQVVGAAVAWVKRVAGQVGNRDSVVYSGDARSDAVHGINEELVFGLVEEDA